MRHQETLETEASMPIVMRTIMQAIPDLVWLKDVDGVY